MDKKLCDQCMFCVLVDTGYSNYTVEGTDVYCVRGLQPDEVFDHWYGEDKRLFRADTCPEFTEGGPGAHVDVDRECQRYDWQTHRYAPSTGAAYAEHPEVIAWLDKEFDG